MVGCPKNRVGRVGHVKSGQGRDRTVDLPIFSRTLVPTELPGQQVRIASELSDPDRARTGDLRRDRAAR